MEPEKTYQVEIVCIETGNVESVIGRGLSESKMEKRIMTGLSRINTDKYFVREVEEGK